VVPVVHCPTSSTWSPWQGLEPHPLEDGAPRPILDENRLPRRLLAIQVDRETNDGSRSARSSFVRATLCSAPQWPSYSSTPINRSLCYSITRRQRADRVTEIPPADRGATIRDPALARRRSAPGRTASREAKADAAMRVANARGDWVLAPRISDARDIDVATPTWRQVVDRENHTRPELCKLRDHDEKVREREFDGLARHKGPRGARAE
jgi:hypothetical protein